MIVNKRIFEYIIIFVRNGIWKKKMYISILCNCCRNIGKEKWNEYNVGTIFHRSRSIGKFNRKKYYEEMINDRYDTIFAQLHTKD